MALYWAAENADDSSARLLLDCGADVNASQIEPFNSRIPCLCGPLAAAVLSQDYLSLQDARPRKSIVELLLKAGASPDVDVTDDISHAHSIPLLSATTAIEHGEELVGLLVSADANVNPNFTSCGCFHRLDVPLYTTVICQNMEAVRYLLGNGADPNYILRPCCFSEGLQETPLDVARDYNGPKDITELLLEHGAVLASKADVKKSTIPGRESHTQPLQGRRILPLRARRKVKDDPKSS